MATAPDSTATITSATSPQNIEVRILRIQFPPTYCPLLATYCYNHDVLSRPHDHRRYRTRRHTTAQVRFRRPHPLYHAGRGDGPGPYVRLYERRVTRPHVEDEEGHLLEPLPQQALVQGRGVRQRAVGERTLHRLRPGRASYKSRAKRRG